MVDYISSYIVTKKELSKVCDDIRLKVRECLEDPNRLHNFLHLYEIARTVIEELANFDKEGFIAQISNDLDTVRANMDIELQIRAQRLQNDIDAANAKAIDIEKELHERGHCIESVLAGMNKIGDYQLQINEINDKMKELECNLKKLEDLRQTLPFIEMCKLAANES